MARNNGKTEQETAIVKPAVDIDFLDIPTPEELIDLEQIEQPLVEIKDYLNQPVIIRSAEWKMSTKQGAPNAKYLILDVQNIMTGESFKSSCSHWFMMAFIKACEEKGKAPFPVALKFYQDGQSIKFEGVTKKQLAF